MAPRKENCRVFGRQRGSTDRLDDPTVRVRNEARAVAKRERAELKRARAKARRPWSRGQPFRRRSRRKVRPVVAARGGARY